MDYRQAGVDIDSEAEFIRRLVSQINFERADYRRYASKFGFTVLIEFGDYYIAINTDGVGSKVIVANRMRRWDTVAIDCVAMNVNDTVTVGAEPLAFVDYISLSEYDMEMAEQIGRGFNEAARLANITIVGGETATLPEITNGVDIAGTSIGIVKKNRLISGEKVKEGDMIYGIPSSGIHSN
jgi:phosphoribosylformylglycinamidine cyclo-ligase